MVYFERATLRFDGSCRPNPGFGGSGYKIVDSDDDGPIIQGYRYVGNTCTSNVAEYFGLIAGLKRLRDSSHKIGHLTIEGDSELVIKQMTKKYRVNHSRMRKLHRMAVQLIGSCTGRSFDSHSFVHIDRRYNVEADRLANEARTEEKNWSVDHYC